MVTNTQLSMSAYGSPSSQSLKQMLKRLMEGWESRSDSRVGVGRPQESASSGFQSSRVGRKTQTLSDDRMIIPK